MTKKEALRYLNNKILALNTKKTDSYYKKDFAEYTDKEVKARLKQRQEMHYCNLEKEIEQTEALMKLIETLKE